MQRNPNRKTSSLSLLRFAADEKPPGEQKRPNKYRQPRKRAALRAHRDGRVRKNVFV